MRRIGWRAVAGFGIAGVLVVSPAVLASEGAKERSTASDQMGHDASGHMGHDSPAASGDAATGSGSEARGSGQAGASTGDVTGSSSASGTSEREAAKAAEATNQLWGKVQKFDREGRTLSLEDSDKKLKVTDDTQVLKDGDRISPGQIMEGDEIRASYAGPGASDVIEVVIIEVVPANPATGSTSPSSSTPPPAIGGADKATGGSSEPSGGSMGASTTK